MLEDPYEYNLQQPTSRFWGWTLAGWLVLLALICAGMTYCHLALGADPEPVIVRKGNDYVRLTHNVCTPNLPGYMTGKAVLDGKPYKLCWKLVRPEQGPLHIVIKDGDIWRADPKAFGPESSNPAGI